MMIKYWAEVWRDARDIVAIFIVTTICVCVGFWAFGEPPMVFATQDPVPVEGKKNRDKHKHVEPDPVTPAPAPHIEPEPDPNFTDVVDIEKRPKPRPQPDSVAPVAPSKPVVIHKGSWSSWFGGVFFGIVLGLGAAWASTLASVRKWIGL